MASIRVRRVNRGGPSAVDSRRGESGSMMFASAAIAELGADPKTS
jgi:hypothetical protein